MNKLMIVEDWCCDQDGSPHHYEVYVSEKQVHFEIQGVFHKSFAGIGSLINFMTQSVAPYTLTCESCNTLREFADEGFAAILAVKSYIRMFSVEFILTWSDNREYVVSLMIEQTVRKEFREAIYQLLSDLEIRFNDKGVLIVADGRTL